MAELVDYEVAREHLGDNITKTDAGGLAIVATHFVKGDTRTADPSVVKALVDSGVLLAPGGEKAEPGHKNKADPKPKNKGEAADKAAADKAGQ